MKHLFIALTVACQSWALTTSDPITLSQISPLQAKEQTAALSMNSQGDVAVSWKDFFSESSEAEALQVALQEKGSWSSPVSFSTKGALGEVFCGIDDGGTVSLFWINEERSLFARTLQQGAWSEPILLTQPAKQEKLCAFRSLNQNGKCFFLFQKGEPESSNWWGVQEYSLKTIDFSPVAKLEAPQHLGGSKEVYSFGLALATDFEDNQFVFWEKMQEGNTVFGSAFRSGKNAEWISRKDLSLSGPCFADVQNLQAALSPRREVCVVGISEDMYSSHKSIWALESKLERKKDWSEPSFIWESDEEVGDLQVAADSEGNYLAIWSQTVGRRSALYSAYKPAGQPWEPTTQLTPASEIHSTPFLRADGSGHFVLVWHQLKDWKQGLIFASSFSHGAWSSPLLLSPPQIVANSTTLHSTKREKGRRSGSPAIL
jgi:hypothetical protein